MQKNSILSIRTSLFLSILIFTPFLVSAQSSVNAFQDQSVSCFGFNDGSCQTAVLPNANYTFQLDGGTQTNTSGVFNGLTPGIHTICVTGGIGTVCDTIMIEEPDALQILFVVDSLVSCHGNDGQLSAVITGGTNALQGYLTEWRNSSSLLLNPSPNNYDLYVTGLAAGVYSLNIEDDHGCFLTQSTILGNTTPLNVAASFTAIACNGGTSVITPSSTGGDGAVSFTVNGISLQANYPAGTYNIIGTDTRGCTNSTTITITQPAPSNSTTNATASNSYTWTENGVTYTSSGIYTYTYINTSGCVHTSTLNLTINNSSLSSVTAFLDQSVSCYGLNDGSCQTTVLPNGSYIYQLDGGVQTNNTGFFNGLTPGVHTVCVTGGTGTLCDTVFIDEPDALQIQFVVDSLVSCHGNDGQLSAVITGGTNLLQGYLTSWMNSSNVLLNPSPNNYDLYVTGLSAGAYSLMIEDDRGCFLTQSTTLGSTTPLNVSASYTSIACNGGTSVITPSSTGGDGTVSFTVNGLALQANYPAGSYIIIGTDTRGCTNATSITITQPAPSNSTTNIIASNSYTWNENGVTYTNSGIYIYTYINTAGCVHTSTLNLTINNSSLSSVTAFLDQSVSCYGLNDGSCQTSVLPNGSYTYQLDGGVQTNNTGFFNGLTPGVHTVCVTGGTGTLCDTVFIDEPDALQIQFVVDSLVSCHGNDGQLSAVITGGTNLLQGYLTSWTNSSNVLLNPSPNNYDLYVTGLSAGVYSLTIEDDRGCFLTQSTTLGSTTPLNVTASFTSINCNGGTSVITPSSTGGDGAVTFTVNGLALQANYPAGTYNITGTDTRGCTNSTTITITQPAPSNSTSFITASNSYTWNENGVTYTNSGIYIYTYINTSGCVHTSTLNLTINIASLSSVTAFLDQSVSCHGLNDGSCQTTASPNGSYIYQLDGGAQTNITGFFSGLTPGVHTVCASDGMNIVCDTVFIEEPDALQIQFVVDSLVSCHGNDGQLSAVITGGTNLLQGYVTSWTNSANILLNPPPDNFNQFIIGLSAGVYSLTIEDDHGCFLTQSVTLGTDAPLLVTGTYTPIICNGGTSILSVSSTGGSGVVSITVNGLPLQTSYPAGTYSIVASDARACTSEAIITITEPAPLNSNLVASACDSYTWIENGMTYLASGIYTHTITNSFGCTGTTTLNLTIHQSSSSSTTVSVSSTYTWPVNGVTYSTTGTYTASFINTAGCDSVLVLNLSVTGISISPKVFLSGAYNTSAGLMTDSLRTNNLIPLTEPYSYPPFNKPQISGLGGETTTAAVLSVTGNDAIVDWVFVELRSASNPSSLIATKRALLQRDGDVVSHIDGASSLSFTSITTGNYYVSIKHRNHLGAMTATALPLSSSSANIDFTTATPVYTISSITTNAPRKIIGAVYLLWGGDANHNKNSKYNGVNNDKDQILGAVGVATPNNILTGYRTEDVNMDGKVRYNNTDNDKNFILTQIGVATPNILFAQHLTD